jgi:MOSC domain-containing protein YiiM/ferredoxin-NADP reductase
MRVATSSEEASMARLLSVNVGMPRDVEWRGRVVHTGIWKEPVRGRCRVRRLNVDGDGQGDPGGHGGEQRAVFVYQIESYRYWQERLGRSNFTHGQFGENFTVEGLSDDEVCIGDRYRIGTALFEVTQPRVTCFRVGIRMNEPAMPSLLTSSGRPGFYFRVLEEGEVGAGDPIALVSQGPEQMTVAAINALLYSSNHPRDELERALKIPALSPGWRWSFDALLRNQGASGNAGLMPAIAAQTAKPGFGALRIARIDRECEDVISLVLQPTDGRALTVALPGQFVVVRLRPRPDGAELFRSYSLSGPASDEQYRISVKIEPRGAAGTYLSTGVPVGAVLDVSEPRGSFTLQPGNNPVVLLSAGIGATPVLAMLHALAGTSSPREVWWLHCARNSKAHSFASEAAQLVGALSSGRSHIWYSRALPEDRTGVRYDETGHIDVPALERLGVPRDADFYICGPATFSRDLQAGLATWGVARDRIHSELFAGGPSLKPGVVGTVARAPHSPESEAGTGPLVSFARSGIAVRWRQEDQSLLELAEACDVPVRWSCRIGVCHNCETGLISGRVAYQPQPLDAPAAGNILICCSRPQEDVVIDL